MEKQEHQLYDPSAERAILSGCIKYGAEVFVEADDLLTDRSFFIDSNQIWYKCLRYLFNEDFDVKPDIPLLISTAESLGFKNQIDNKDEKTHLRSILNMPVEQNNVRKFAVKIRKLEIARAGLEVNNLIEKGLLGVDGNESVQAILNLLENPVYEFTASLDKDQESPKKIGEDLEAFIEYLAVNPVEQVGLPSSFKNLDKGLGGGLRKGSVTTIGARSGVGKSSISINVGLSLSAGFGYTYPKISNKQIPVLYLDTEMGGDDHKIKTLANLSSIIIDNIETGKFGKVNNDYNKIKSAGKFIESIPYFHKSIAGMPFEQCLSIMRSWLKKEVGLNGNGKANDCLIIYDYIKLMDSTGLSNHLTEFQALGFIMTGLHNFAVKYQVPILCSVQLNRDGINSEDSSAVSGSDRILWLTSNLIYYKLQDQDEIASQPQKDKFRHKFVIIKQRYGKGLADKDFIHIKANGEYCRIIEGPLNSEMTKAQGSFEINDESIE